MSVLVYSLTDFENISWNSKFTLDDTTIELINNLSNQVSAPTYVKTPNFKAVDKPHRKKKGIPDTIKEEDWHAIRNFKKTEMVKKDGIDKEIDKVRLLINKLTDKTYNVVSEKIFTTLDELCENEQYDTECIDKIGYAIFTMATANKFNSNIYAKLCSMLQDKYDFMIPIISKNIAEFMKIFDNMTFVDPNDDYDKFCDMNIENDKRRALSLFLTSLEKHNVVTHEFVIDTILTIQAKMMTSKNDGSKQMENDELVESLFIMITNLKSPISSVKWKDIYTNIIDIKSNKYLGITNKCKFKHMDIIDYISKQK